MRYVEPVDELPYQNSSSSRDPAHSLAAKKSRELFYRNVFSRDNSPPTLQETLPFCRTRQGGPNSRRTNDSPHVSEGRPRVQRFLESTPLEPAKSRNALLSNNYSSENTHWFYTKDVSMRKSETTELKLAIGHDNSRSRMRQKLHLKRDSSIEHMAITPSYFIR